MPMYKVMESGKDFSLTIDSSTELSAAEWYAQQFKVEKDCVLIVEPRGYKAKRVQVTVHRTYSVQLVTK